MENMKYGFVLEEREKLLRFFAFTQGWNRQWLLQNQESSERLYGRKFDLQEVAADLVAYKGYPLNEHECLDHSFLQAFFKNFPQIEILQRPDITFVAAPISPRIIDNRSYEDAWKHHAQVLVLMKPRNRIDYLYSYVPEWIKDDLEKRRKERTERINELDKTTP